MGEAVFSFTVDDELRNKFAAVAEARQCSDAELLRDCMLEVVQEEQEADGYDAWFRRAVQTGLDQAAAGELIPAEEVEAEFAAMRAELRGRMNDGR